MPALLTLIAVEGSAQETVAAGTLNAQMSWTALQNQISKVSGQITALQIDTSAMKTCSVKGKLYSTNNSVTRDTDHCREAVMDMTTVNAILKCNAKGKLYTTSKAVSKDEDDCREIDVAAATPTVRVFGGYNNTGGTGYTTRNLGKWTACFVSRYNTVENNHHCETRQVNQTQLKGQNNSMTKDGMDYTPDAKKAWVMTFQQTFCAVTCFK